MFRIYYSKMEINTPCLNAVIVYNYDYDPLWVKVSVCMELWYSEYCLNLVNIILLSM